jgi:5-hydroxyisourate hydrolase
MSKITTHVLDTVLGKPAREIAMRLERQDEVNWTAVTQAVTDDDGRCCDLAPDAAPGVYRLIFETGPYLDGLGRQTIYPQIVITFTCGGDAHYHLPLLLSDNSYTTYRGS